MFLLSLQMASRFGSVHFFALLLTTRFCLVWCASLRLTHNSSAISVLNFNDSTPLKATNTSDLFGAHGLRGQCGTPNTWSNPLFNTQDCQGAVDWLFIAELYSQNTQSTSSCLRALSQRRKSQGVSHAEWRRRRGSIHFVRAKSSTRAPKYPLI